MFWVDDVSSSAELKEKGTPSEKFLETEVSVLKGSPLAGFKLLSGFSGESWDSSGSVSSLGMTFPSEDNSSSRRKKTKAIIFNRLIIQILLKGQKSNLQQQFA